MTTPRRPDVSDLVEIGRGGFGVVYRARQERFRRDVAVKIITATLDERARGRFTQECRALGQLSGHPHIVPVYDGGVDPDGHGFLIMPFLASGSLADQLARSGPLGWREALDVGVRLAGALQTAHDAGILHRDLKPANVLLDEYGSPRLADFGQARFADTDLTRSGEITATPGYAAPEIINGQPATAAADVYSLAATVMALMIGRAPFDAGNGDGSIAPLLFRVLAEPPPNLRPSGVPAPVAGVLEAAMAKEPGQRPESALALGIALQRAQQSLGLPATPMSVAGTQLLPPAVGPSAAQAGTVTYGAPDPAGPAYPHGPDVTAVSPFPAGLTAALPGGAPSPAGPPPPAARRSRRPLYAALGAVLVAALVVAGFVVVRALTAPEPRQGLVGRDLLIEQQALPGSGWALEDTGTEGPLQRFFVSGESLLACLGLPTFGEGSEAGQLANRDLALSDLYVDDQTAVQTGGLILASPERAQDVVEALRPPGLCRDDMRSLATYFEFSVDSGAEPEFTAPELGDLPSAVDGSAVRLVLPLEDSDSGASELVVEFVFLSAGSAVACAGLVVVGDEPTDALRTTLVDQLVAQLTE